MRIQLAFLLIFSAILAVLATDEKATDPKGDSRLFILSQSISFTTFTVIKATTTTTSTFTSTTTCTTSTSALTTCTAGRRRRGLFYDEAEKQGRARRGLFYDEDETESKDGSVFLPASEDTKSRAERQVNPAEEVPTVPVDESAVVPLDIQPGFNVPEGSPFSRFLLAFGTSTRTIYTITTTTSTLTAICSSTTGFSLCGSG